MCLVSKFNSIDTYLKVVSFSTGVLEMTGTDNIRFSGSTLDKATKAKVTLENFYTNLITQHLERKQRYVEDSSTSLKCSVSESVICPRTGEYRKASRAND